MVVITTASLYRVFSSSLEQFVCDMHQNDESLFDQMYDAMFAIDVSHCQSKCVVPYATSVF